MFEPSVEIYIICNKTDIRYGDDSLAGGSRSLGIENSTIEGDTFFEEVELTESSVVCVKMQDS